MTLHQYKAISDNISKREPLEHQAASSIAIFKLKRILKLLKSLQDGLDAAFWLSIYARIALS